MIKPVRAEMCLRKQTMSSCNYLSCSPVGFSPRDGVFVYSQYRCQKEKHTPHDRKYFGKGDLHGQDSDTCGKFMSLGPFAHALLNFTEFFHAPVVKCFCALCCRNTCSFVSDMVFLNFLKKNVTDFFRHFAQEFVKTNRIQAQRKRASTRPQVVSPRRATF